MHAYVFVFSFFRSHEHSDVKKFRNFSQFAKFSRLIGCFIEIVAGQLSQLQAIERVESQTLPRVVFEKRRDHEAHRIVSVPAFPKQVSSLRRRRAQRKRRKKRCTSGIRVPRARRRKRKNRTARRRRRERRGGLKRDESRERDGKLEKERKMRRLKEGGEMRGAS